MFIDTWIRRRRTIKRRSMTAMVNKPHLDLPRIMNLEALLLLGPLLMVAAAELWQNAP
jgi:hypothetical protein